MANQKLTSKVELLSISDNDVIHVVDVSDTTGSPEGTSKQMKYSLIKSKIPTNTSQLNNDGEVAGAGDSFALRSETSPVSKNKDYLTTPHFTLNAISEIQQGISTTPRGVFVFGDSMKDIPAGYLLGKFEEYNLVRGGLGAMPYYNFEKNGSVGTGSAVVLNGGAVSVPINTQQITYGKTEWVDDIYVVNGAGQSIDFNYNGVAPKSAIQKIYILTEVGGGTYTIQSNTASAGWVNVSIGNSADAPTGMLVHTFDNTASTSAIQYRILWESGIVKTIGCAIYFDNSKFIHIKVGIGGADYKLQCSVDVNRVRFLLQDLNVCLATSVHRYEVANAIEMQTAIDKLDAWWSGLPIDVYYPQQWAVTNGDDVLINLENDIIRKKCIAKGYITLDTYNELGGVSGVTLGGYDSADPIHLNLQARDIHGAMFLDLFKLDEMRGLLKHQTLFSKVSKFAKNALSAIAGVIGTNTIGLDFNILSNRYLKLGKGTNVDAPTEVGVFINGKLVSVGKKIVFAHDANNNAKLAAGNYPTLEAIGGGTPSNYLKVKKHYGTGAYGNIEAATDATRQRALVNIKTADARYVRMVGYTVANLPAGTLGDVAYVTDASAPTYLSAVTGGGTVKCMVFHNGTTWVAN